MTVRPPGTTSILQAVEKRGDTDTHPSYFVHVILPFLLTVGAALLVLAIAFAQGHTPESVASTGLSNLPLLMATIGVAALAVVASIVLWFRGWYLLIQRRNDHFARDRVLRQGLLEYTRRVSEIGGGEKSGDHLESMQRLHNEALLDENERQAGVHLLLVVLTGGLWGLHILYFLLKDFPHHSRRQARFVREARSSFDDNDLNQDKIPQLDPLDERSYLASLALWIFIPVIGPFVVTWWLYEDPLEHFKQQWDHEEGLVNLVQEEEPLPEPSTRHGGAGPEEAPPEQEREEADTDTREEQPPEPEEEPEHTIWQCGQCDTKYKVPPKRPVRVTCKNCQHREVLED